MSHTEGIPLKVVSADSLGVFEDIPCGWYHGRIEKTGYMGSKSAPLYSVTIVFLHNGVIRRKTSTYRLGKSQAGQKTTRLLDGLLYVCGFPKERIHEMEWQFCVGLSVLFYYVPDKAVTQYRMSPELVTKSEDSDPQLVFDDHAPLWSPAPAQKIKPKSDKVTDELLLNYGKGDVM